MQQTSTSSKDHFNFVVANDDYDVQGALLHAPKEKALVLDFTATWCGPCKMIGPVFESLSKSYPDVLFLKVDVDKCPQTAKKYGIKGFPTFLFLIDGDEVERFSGANRDKLTSRVEFWSHAGKVKQSTTTTTATLSYPTLRQENYRRFDSIKTDAMVKAINQNIEKSNIALSNEQKTLLSCLKSTLDSGTSQNLHQYFELAKHLCENLPTAQIFPVLDLMKFLALKEDEKIYLDPFLVDLLRKYCASDDAGLLEKTDVPSAVPLLCLRIVCNVASHKKGRAFLSKGDNLNQIVHSACAAIHSSNKNLSRTGLILLYNLSTSLPRSNCDATVEVLSCIIQQLLSEELDNDSCNLLLLAVGRLMLDNKESIELAKGLKLDMSVYLSASTHTSEIKTVAKEIQQLMNV